MAACSYSPTLHIHLLREWMSDSKDPHEIPTDTKITSVDDKYSLISVVSFLWRSLLIEIMWNEDVNLKKNASKIGSFLHIINFVFVYT